MTERPLGASSFFRRNPGLEALSDRFEVLGVLGQGGMGSVFRARDRASGREVALKLVSEPERDPRRLERFRREGTITASLSHPGIVRVHSAGEAGGYPFLAYELVEGGRTLADVLAKAPLEERVRLVRDVARALGYAHGKGVVHRDVKPENVLVDAKGAAHVADFGLAAAQGLDRLTRSGAMLGTPSYMSPEQLGGRREDVGPQADVWSLGVMLYQALTGQLPFEAESVVELGARIMNGAIVPPRKLAPQVPGGLEAVCLKALSRDVDARYVDGEELARDVDRALAGHRTTASGSSVLAAAVAAPRTRRTAVVLGGLAVFGVALVLALRVGSGGGGGGDTRPPTLIVRAPAAGTSVWGEAIEVTGSVSDGSAVTLSVTGPAGAAPPQTLARPGSFTARAPLSKGDNELVVEAKDAAGNVTREARRVTRLSPPGWYEVLSPADRPTLPLPAGLSFGAAEGEYQNAKDGATLVWIPPGSFVMGSDRDEPDERPAHRVRLTRGFYLSKYEVTLGQWQRFCRETRRPAPEVPADRDERHPFARATWEAARDYCAWAGLRLPTEAEWELAARGPDSLRFPWGGSDHGHEVRCNSSPDHSDGRSDPFEETAPVGSFPLGASPFGLHDMAGNVYEWVSDWYAEGYPVAPGGERVDPVGPDLGQRRGLRGGAFNCGTVYCRASDRFSTDPRDAHVLENLGLRPARSAEGP